MISNFVAVAMHGPVEVFLKAMRVTVVFDHLQVILDGFEHCRCVVEGRCGRPEQQGQAGQRRDKAPPG